MAQLDGPVVMLVDDYADTREILRRAIEKCGCSVVEAEDGQAAIELSQSALPDLILMDLNMPVLDGVNATIRIREYGPTRDIPIVAITAHDSPEFRAAAGAVGCSEYLAKPIDFESLSEVIGRLLPRTSAKPAVG